MCQVGRRERAIDIDLERGDVAVEMRLLAERQIGLAGETTARSFGPYWNATSCSDAAAASAALPFASRIVHHPLAARQRGADRPRQRNVAVELRRVVIDGERAVDVGGQGIGWIDASLI